MTGLAGTLAAAFLFFAPTVAALAPGPLGDPSPYADDAIRAVYTTRLLESLEGFQVDVDLRVHELEIPPAAGRTASELRAAPEPVRALFEEQARAGMLNEAARVLPDARVSLTAFAVSYGEEDYDANPYDPPLEVQAVIRADFTPAFFGLAASTKTPPRDLARALLYSGGVYAVARDLEVPAGYDVQHVVDVPDFLQLSPPGAPSTDRLVFHRDNSHGTEADRVRLDFDIRVRPEDVPANVLDGPLVKARFIVDDVTPKWKQSVPFLGGDYRGELDLDIQVHSLSAGLFGAHPLPRQVTLQHVSADLLRIAIRERLVLRSDVEAFFDGLLRRSLEESFGPDVRLELDWDALSASLNDPVGGPTVRPLLVRAHAFLPFTSNKMLVSSSLGRLVGMTVGTSGSFDLANDGLWNAEYTVAYPKGVHVKVRDSAGLTTDENWGQREGFRVNLPRGAHTRIHVEGRSDFDPAVFSIGALELALVGIFLWSLGRRLRTSRRPKRTPIVAQNMA